MAHDLTFAFLAGFRDGHVLDLPQAGISRHSPRTGVAFLANLALTVTLKASGAPVSLTKQSSLYFVSVVGLAAACADLFTLSAYSSGLKVTSTFVIGGTSTALVLLVGFMVLKEPFTWMKLFAIGLIAIGVFLLQRQGI